MHCANGKTSSMPSRPSASTRSRTRDRSASSVKTWCRESHRQRRGILLYHPVPPFISKTRAVPFMTAIAATVSANQKSGRSLTSASFALSTSRTSRISLTGQRDQMQNDLRNLLRQGLVRKGVFEGPEQTPRELLTLSKRGQRLIRSNRMVPSDQTIYSGFVKPREANHDANLYKLYNKEIARILKEGGRNPRVILDFELKRKINRDLAKFGREARPEITRSHGLRVVRGRIPVPDVRIEYEKPNDEMARVDLELVTEHYRGRSLADKVKAGFSLYTARGEGDRLRRVLDGQELTAEIFSL